ncbi:MAG: ATP-binding protein [Steroidobacteraceae bacterium]
MRSPRHWFTGLRTTVRGKIITLTLVTSVIVVLVAGSAMMSHDLRVYRDSLASDLTAVAGIVALTSAPALEFDDRRAAQRTLEALQARKDLLTAALYEANGSLFAAYVRLGETAPPAQAGTVRGLLLAGDVVELRQPLERKGEVLGTIYLRARYDLSARVQAYSKILALVMVISVGIAAVLADMLQRTITRPLDSMTRVARQVVQRRDYSLRVLEGSQDETGIVIDAFNRMLDEIQARTRALEGTNAALTEEIRTRQIAEQAVRSSEKLYRAIGESLDFGVWVASEQGEHIYASESYLRLTGMTMRDYLGDGWAAALPAEEREEALAAWRDCVRSGEAWYREMRVRGIDGRQYPVLSQGVPIKGDQGEISGWAGIHLDITRLKRTEEALREADRRKDEFLATLAHELRNPLAPIRHATKILDNRNVEESRRQWGRDVISRQVERMALLLDDLLDVSRITRGRLTLRKSTVELRPIISAAIEIARPLLEARHHHLQTEIPTETLWLEADPLRLSQALSNLLTNAAKYTQDQGHIRLRVALEESHLVMSVQDDGIGIAERDFTRLFEMFSQVQSTPARAEGGLGIGLALVRGLVELHGGSISVHSEGRGLGSRFEIRLPRSLLAHAPQGLAHPASPAPLAGPERSALRVLLADDNRDAADSLSMVLEMAGYEVRTVYSGREALLSADRFRPHAMVLDIGMPDVDGYEVARAIRVHAWGENLLLIAITGWGQAHDKERARQSGFDVHLTKPVDPDKVDRILASRLRGDQA